MTDKGDFIKRRCYRLKVGECLTVELRFFQDAFPTDYHFFGIYKIHNQAFLSSMMGSAWGAWTAEINSENFTVLICRHKETNKRVYIDPDREHLFEKMPDGELVLK